MSTSTSKRPEFMATLGLLPPYTEDEVKQAYRSKANAAHPDHGGDVEEFRAIREAYDQAQAYVKFHGDKRTWIAEQVGQSMVQERVEAELVAAGATVDTEIIEWLQATVGDFAELTRSIVAVNLRNADADAALKILAGEHQALHRLKRLNLSGCRFRDELARGLGVLRGLEALDVTSTSIRSQTAISLAESLPLLVSYELKGTPVGWLAKRKIRRTLQHNSSRARFLMNPAGGESSRS